MENLSNIKKTQSWLSWFARGIMILGFLFLFGRLFELQIIKGAYYRDLSDNNRIRKVVIPAPRGRILARGGEVIVDNNFVKKVVVFDPVGGYSLDDPKEDDSDFEKIEVSQRVYKLGERAGHLTGYLGKVDESELGKVDPDCIQKGPKGSESLVGKTGLEESYDCKLRGIDGEELIEVDTMGRKLRVLGIKNPIPGEDLNTNIDFGLQTKVSEVFKEKKGAVVITSKKGLVLALYSAPSYDPSTFVDKTKIKSVGKLLTDSDLPLFNRAIGATYHPGSVFKPFVTIAALETGAIDPDYTFTDDGFIEIKSIYGNYIYNNWYYTQYGGREGEIGIEKALARSTDTFFYKVGELTGIDELDSWAEKFGLNIRSGIDLPSEVSGFVPSPEWKEEIKNEKWFLGNTYHMSIGQGDLALTPILVNKIPEFIASDGKLCTPKIVGEPYCKSLDVESKYIDIVKEGMANACSTGGTAFPFFDFNPEKLDDDKRVACKTGTAETLKENVTHAWFSAFAPVDDPKLVATVIVEEGGEGSSEAAPIVREIFNYFFARKN